MKIKDFNLTMVSMVSEGGFPPNEPVKEAPEILVLVGVPGSGKSTWIRQFTASSQKQYVVISSDDILEKIAAEKGLTYSDVHKDYIGQATGQAKATFRQAMNNRANIIWDQTNVSKKKRRGILQQLPKDYIAKAVVFNTEDAVVKDRLQKRAKETGKHIPDFVMKDMYSRWEAPTRDEGFAEIIKA